MTVIMVAAALVLGFAEFPKDIGLSEDKTRQLMQAVDRIASAEYRASRSSQEDVAAASDGVVAAAGKVQGAQQALDAALDVVSALDTPPLGQVANYAFGLGMEALDLATSVPLGPIDTGRALAEAMKLVEGLPVGALADSGKAAAMEALRAGKEAADAVVNAVKETKAALEDFMETFYEHHLKQLGPIGECVADAADCATQVADAVECGTSPNCVTNSASNSNFWSGTLGLG